LNIAGTRTFLPQPRVGFELRDLLREIVEGYGSQFPGPITGRLPPIPVHTLPGRNRFGEIAIVAVLSFEKETRMLEYSFGEREVGSIRFLDGFPARVVYPESRTSFV